LRFQANDLKKTAAFILFVGLWQACASLDLLNQQILPSPVDTLRAAVEGIRDGSLLVHVIGSIRRVFVGFGAAVLLGVPLGVLLGVTPRLSPFFTSIFEALRPIPPIAWIPIAILWFGLGDPSAYFIVFVGAFFPTFISSYWGVQAVKKVELDAARNLGAGPVMLLTDVLIPAALPRILTGMRISLGLAWTSVIAAELVGAQSGLGYMIQLNRILLNTDAIVVGMICIGLIGLAMNRLMALVTKQLTPWDRDTIAAHPGI